MHRHCEKCYFLWCAKNSGKQMKWTKRRKMRKKKLKKQINVITVLFCVLIYSQSGVGVKNTDWAHRTHLNFAFTTHWNTHHLMLLKSCIIESIQKLITTLVILAWLRLTFLIPCYWFNKILNSFYMHFCYLNAEHFFIACKMMKGITCIQDSCIITYSTILIFHFSLDGTKEE